MSSKKRKKFKKIRYVKKCTKTQTGIGTEKTCQKETKEIIVDKENKIIKHKRKCPEKEKM